MTDRESPSPSTLEERDLTIMRNMEATNAFICWECRTVKIKNTDWFAAGGCEVCKSRGYVLPFLLRPTPASGRAEALEAALREMLNPPLILASDDATEVAAWFHEKVSQALNPEPPR